MATPLPFPSLEENPRIHFATFERHVYDDAGSSCCDLFPHGLLFLVVSDTTWAALPSNSTIVDGVFTIAARPTFAPPVQPPDNATTGVWKAFETRRKLFDIYAAAALLLLRRLKLTLPIADINLLSHPILGLVNYSAFQLMEHLRQTYGTFQATDFNKLYLALDHKITSTTDFPTLAAKFRLIFEQFSANNQPLSELQKCNYLSNAIAAIPHLVKTQDTFYHLHPLPQDRQFLQLIHHIAVHAPNFVPTASDLGYVAAATSIPPSTEISNFLASSQFATIIATAAAAIAKTSPPIQHRPPRHAKPATPPTSRLYCYVHGYDWHSGTACKKMAKDPSLYPPGAITAPTHLSITGGNITKH